MTLETLKKILLRLNHQYVKQYLHRLIFALLSNLDSGPRHLIILEPKLDAKSIPINLHIVIQTHRKKASII